MDNPKYIQVMRQVASDFDGISHELFQVASDLERMDQYNPQQKLFSLVRSAEVSSVTLRNLTARTVRDDTAPFYCEVADLLGIKVEETHDWLKISVPAILPKRNQRDTGTCREYYQNNVDSFILVSSDSDYWGLISAMPEVRFFVMVESEKCSPTIKNALINAGISYCYIDDFCTGNSNDIKVAAVLREVRQKLDQAFHLNVRDILDEACRATRADMTTAEKNQFYEKYIKTMHVDISPNGEATIVLGK